MGHNSGWLQRLSAPLHYQLHPKQTARISTALNAETGSAEGFIQVQTLGAGGHYLTCNTIISVTSKSHLHPRNHPWLLKLKHSHAWTSCLLKVSSVCCKQTNWPTVCSAGVEMHVHRKDVLLSWLHDKYKHGDTIHHVVGKYHLFYEWMCRTVSVWPAVRCPQLQVHLKFCSFKM